MRPQTVLVSATPGNWEMERTGGVFVEQVIRPTGLIDPPVEVRPARSAGRRSARRSPRGRAQGLPHARHRADQAHGRGPDRISARERRARALHAFRHRHDRAHRNHPRSAPRRLRRARRHQPAARGPRHSRMRARRHSRRRQGRLSALAKPRWCRRSAAPRATSTARSSSMPIRSPARWSAPSPRPTAVARSRWNTISSTASRRKRIKRDIADILGSVYERDHVTVDVGARGDGKPADRPQSASRRSPTWRSACATPPPISNSRRPRRLRDEIKRLRGGRTRHRRRSAGAPAGDRRPRRLLRGRAEVRVCREPAGEHPRAKADRRRYGPAQLGRRRSAPAQRPPAPAVYGGEGWDKGV